jgi:hypothetical protein
MDIKKKKLTQARLKELFHYDPETGIFTSLTPPSDKPIVGRPRNHPDHKWTVHPRITIDGESIYYAHLAWLYVYGKFPRRLIHVNKNFCDLRIKNLYVPAKKPPPHKRIFAGRRGTASKIMGVTYHKGSRYWQASVSVGGKRISQMYKSFLDAVFARYALEQCLGIEQSKNRYKNSAGNYLKKRGLVAK